MTTRRPPLSLQLPVACVVVVIVSFRRHMFDTRCTMAVKNPPPSSPSLSLSLSRALSCSLFLALSRSFSLSVSPVLINAKPTEGRKLPWAVHRMFDTWAKRASNSIIRPHVLSLSQMLVPDFFATPLVDVRHLLSEKCKNDKQSLFSCFYDLTFLILLLRFDLKL